MTTPTCPICGHPIHRDPVLFRAQEVHKLCELAAQAQESQPAAEALFATLGQSQDAVEWDTTDTV